MTKLTITLIGGIAAALITTPILAQQQGAEISAACRQEVVKLCGTDRSKVRTCVRENFAKLSESCGKEIRAQLQARQPNRSQPQPAPQGQD